MPVRCDIFCRVIDNYGDIGVCWRLARRLAQGHGWAVRVWVDDPATLARIEPLAAPSGARPHGVEIVAWREPVPAAPEPADVVIEAFACDPPADYLARLGPEQVWLNVEYLSAEDWVQSHHGLPSPQGGGRVKHFFFPGFTERTGGLMREPGLPARRDAFQADPAAIAHYLCGLGFAPALAADVAHGRREMVTLFCYAETPAHALFEALAAADIPRVLALTGGALPGLAAGAHGAVTVTRVPFVAQADYDPLLWAAAVNAVRGEDSFVRAQLAARPMLWNIYPQDEDAHGVKLDAWLDRYPATPALRALHHAWNGLAGREALPGALAAWLAPAEQARLRDAARQWSDTLGRLPELADALVEFCRRRLKF